MVVNAENLLVHTDPKFNLVVQLLNITTLIQDWETFVCKTNPKQWPLSRIKSLKYHINIRLTLTQHHLEIDLHNFVFIQLLPLILKQRVPPNL